MPCSIFSPCQITSNINTVVEDSSFQCCCDASEIVNAICITERILHGLRTFVLDAKTIFGHTSSEDQ
ncbi:hypothetical protein SCLCIDRAFT_455870 [Scleroderma citrinum Foug A]|uniref:Uncharacterized protein n=1 Tax=Scleroderma citrinum Foug A TaxID=1036808 RepID=A0A0C3CXC7_9AGAM|nr:hypothetical protein SCLCIDRAFT_455870 [Scleroderma citrinum Foug A]